MSAHRIIIEPGTVDRHYWRDLWTYRGLNNGNVGADPTIMATPE